MKIIKAESTLSLLMAMMIFAIICLSWLKWQSQQNAQSAHYFQQRQALQIAENQIARQMAGLNCQNRIEQNGLIFEIKLCNSQKIEVSYPKGQIILNSKQ